MNENTKRWLKNAGSFALITAVSVLILWLMSLIAQRVGESTQGDALKGKFEGIISAEIYEEIDISEAGDPYGDVKKAYRAETDGETKGYVIEMVVQGYGGAMEVTAGVSADGKRITGVRVGENSETENLGKLVAENAFLSQFAGVPSPVTLGKSTLNDGTYHAESEGYSDGYKEIMSLTVENGRITRVLWDGESENGGKSKRQASIDGEYVMTADGLMWHEQAQLLEDRLIELQDPSRLFFGDDGKTDAVAGVSIKINSFVSLAHDCCTQAGGSSEGTGIDGVSGATVSSKAMVDAVNTAAEFTNGFILQNRDAVAAEGSESDIYE